MCAFLIEHKTDLWTKHLIEIFFTELSQSALTTTDMNEKEDKGLLGFLKIGRKKTKVSVFWTHSICKLVKSTAYGILNLFNLQYVADFVLHRILSFNF